VRGILVEIQLETSYGWLVMDVMETVRNFI